MWPWGVPQPGAPVQDKGESAALTTGRDVALVKARTTRNRIGVPTINLSERTGSRGRPFAFVPHRFTHIRFYGCPGGHSSPFSFFLAVLAPGLHGRQQLEQAPYTPTHSFSSRRCFQPHPTSASSSSPSACSSSTSAVHIPPHIPMLRPYSQDKRPR